MGEDAVWLGVRMVLAMSPERFADLIFVLLTVRTLTQRVTLHRKWSRSQETLQVPHWNLNSPSVPASLSFGADRGG